MNSRCVKIMSFTAKAITIKCNCKRNKKLKVKKFTPKIQHRTNTQIRVNLAKTAQIVDVNMILVRCVQVRKTTQKSCLEINSSKSVPLDSESDSDSVKYTTRKNRNSCAINGKQARVRTVLNEKQLGMLRACYNMNSRPDALVKEQLVEMTGLSSRVIRVWFQNKRCKDKKKSLEYKSQIQAEKVSKKSHNNFL